VVDSACSINLTTFQIDFVTFAPPTVPSRVGGVGRDDKGIGSVHISIMLASGHAIHRTIHALYTPTFHLAMPSTLVASSMSVGCNCIAVGNPVFLVTLTLASLIMVPTWMGVLEPSGNGLYFPPHQPELPSSPTAESSPHAGPRVALTTECNPIRWHRRFGHLNMQSMHARHTHGVPTSPSLACCVKHVSCDSCLLHKAIVAPRNTTACAKPSRPLVNMSYDLCGPMNVPFPHRLRYCLLAIDHHTHYMCVRLLKFKDETC
jgi:hypothetical protein